MRLRSLCFWLLISAGMGSHMAHAGGSLYLQAFRTLYDGPFHHSDEGHAIAADGQGGCYSGGWNYNPTDADYHARLVAYDGSGNLRWTLTATEPSINTHLRLFRPPALEDVWLAYEANHLAGPFLHVVRISNTGLVRFDKAVPLKSEVRAYPPGLHVDASGHAYLTYGLGGAVVAIKIGPQGNVHWKRAVITSGQAVGTAIQADSQGIYVAGIEKPLAGGYFTAKLKPSGVVEWLTKDAGAIGNTLGPAFLERQGDGIIVVTSPESTFGVPRYRISRLAAATGTVLWTQDYRPSSFTADGEAVGLGVDQAGNAYVAGFRVQPQSGSFVVKYAANGARLWERTLAAGGGHAASDLVVNPQGHAFIGTISGILSGVNAQGQSLYFGQRKGYYRGLAVDSIGHVFAIGSVFNKTTGDDFVTVKLRPQ